MSAAFALQLFSVCSKLCVVLKDPLESSVYRQLADLYDIISCPSLWKFPANFWRDGNAIYLLEVDFRDGRETRSGIQRFCKIVVNGIFKVFDGPVPTSIPALPQKIQQKTCLFCLSLPSNYRLVNPDRFKSSNSTTVIRTDMLGETVNLKAEIAECLELLGRLNTARSRTPLRHCLLEKTRTSDGKEIHAEIDGVPVYSADQPYWETEVEEIEPGMAYVCFCSDLFSTW